MTRELTSPSLRPADLLLYRNNWSLVGFAIQLKTRSDVNHVEVYIGDGHVVAARASGSRVYPLTLDHLHYVWRPSADPPVSLTDAMDWFFHGATIDGRWTPQANGTPYDYWGLFRFYLLGRQSAGKNFCSELAMRWLLAGSTHSRRAPTRTRSGRGGSSTRPRARSCGGPPDAEEARRLARPAGRAVGDRLGEEEGLDLKSGRGPGPPRWRRW